MKGRLTTVGSWWAMHSASHKVCGPGVRPIVMKASDRAAVHGAKPPIPDITDKESVEIDIQRAKEEREKKRKAIEDIVDSQLKNKNGELLSDSTNISSSFDHKG